MLTPKERSKLIKLASNLPQGSEERRAVLAGLVFASEYSDALDSLWKEYRKDHP